MGVKPDVVAPGTKLVSLEAQNSYLAVHYPTGTSPAPARMPTSDLSGTSMSTAVVSGGVALLLDAQDDLTPGAGQGCAADGRVFRSRWRARGRRRWQRQFPAVAEARAKRPGADVAHDGQRAARHSGGATFRDCGTLIDRLYGNSGLKLLGILDLGLLWQQADNTEWGVLNVLGLLNPLAKIPAHRLIWGQVADWTQSNHLVWGDSVQNPSGQHLVWGDSEHTGANHLVWGDAVQGDGGR